MKKNVFVLAIISLLFLTATEIFCRTEKVVEKQFKQKGDKFKQITTLRDNDGNGIYDQYSVDLLHWDNSNNKWYRSGGTTGSIPKIKTTTETNSVADQINFCESIETKSNLTAVLGVQFVPNAQPNFDTADFNKASDILFIDTLNNETPIFAVLHFENGTCVYLEQTTFDITYIPSDETNVRFFKGLYNINDDINYTLEDLNLNFPQTINNNFINIEFGLLRAKTIESIDLFDINGKKISSTIVNNRLNLQIDVSQFNNGSYILNLNDTIGNKYSFNIIINK